MKILVVEDKEMHQNSARETLSGHEVTIIDTFTTAMEKMDKNNYDAVLTDMMLPMSNSNRLLTEESFKKEDEVPYGFIIALKAAACEAKYVAVVTDANHHHDAMSAALHYIGLPYGYGTFGGEKQQIFHVNGARVTFAHAPLVTDIVKDAPCGSCRSTGICAWCEWQGKDCPCRMNGKQGVCPRCNGTLKVDEEVMERKDWGAVLKFLLEKDLEQN